MAKTKRQNGDANQSELISESQVKSPEGFEEIFGERVTGWWALVPGNTIQGILRDTFNAKSKFNSEGKKVYKIELTKSGAQIHPANSDTDATELETAEEGELVGVDEKGFLKSLSRVSIGQEIWIGYLGKAGPSEDYPQGRHVFRGPLAKPAKINPVTGEVS
jgi:hypothetical protein